MDWKFKKDAGRQGSNNGFWYDITDGGYIKISSVLEDQEQVNNLKEAINLLRSFEAALESNDLLYEF